MNLLRLWRTPLVVLSAVFSAMAMAQSYPTRPVRFVVPIAPGGAGDIVARTVAAKLSDLWGGQVIVDNRGGANTIIGTDFVAKAKPDGYTWLLGVQGSLAINPAFYTKLPYDAVKDFDPVTQMTRYGYVLIGASRAAREARVRACRACTHPPRRSRLWHFRDRWIEPSCGRAFPPHDGGENERDSIQRQRACTDCVAFR